MTRHQLSKRRTLITGGWTIDKRLVEYKKLFAKVDAILDKAKTGPLWLKQTDIAELVQQALIDKYAHLYTLWAYVIMANHLHVLLKPKSGSAIGSITKYLKGYTAREANRLLTEQDIPSGKTNPSTTGRVIAPSSFVSLIT